MKALMLKLSEVKFRLTRSVTKIRSILIDRCLEPYLVVNLKNHHEQQSDRVSDGIWLDIIILLALLN